MFYHFLLLYINKAKNQIPGASVLVIIIIIIMVVVGIIFSSSSSITSRSPY